MQAVVCLNVRQKGFVSGIFEVKLCSTIYLKPDWRTRYSKSYIVTHLATGLPCCMLPKLENNDAIGVCGYCNFENVYNFGKNFANFPQNKLLMNYEIRVGILRETTETVILVCD